jgi:hypothetical protein
MKKFVKYFTKEKNIIKQNKNERWLYKSIRSSLIIIINEES